jgi:hypothetical protein
MPIGTVPESFVGLLAAFARCFGAPSYRSFELLIVGRVHCLGRRTIAAVALALVSDRSTEQHRRLLFRHRQPAAPAGTRPSRNERPANRDRMLAQASC